MVLQKHEYYLSALYISDLAQHAEIFQECQLRTRLSNSALRGIMTEDHRGLNCFKVYLGWDILLFIPEHLFPLSHVDIILHSLVHSSMK